jgi:ribose transport system ATP-binding protein
MALVPADRARDGAVGTLSVGDNVTLCLLDQYRNAIALDRRALRRSATALLKQYRVRPDRPEMTFSSLSGGNQQKALMAKWFQTNPRLLLLHEPTQGVDVGSRQEIFGMLTDAARAGTCIVCASSDAEQLAAICHRVVILVRGVAVQELVGGEITKERISEQTYASSALADAETVRGP